ncbi:MAG: DUF421 domain-containing protein [Sporichthyaceae bacterium]
MNYSLNGPEAAAVVVSAIGMYVGVLVLLRLAGRRVVSGLGVYDFAGGIALGALVGRTILGSTPNLPAGLLGLATLGGLHTGSRALSRTSAGERLFGPGPTLLISDGRVVPDALRRVRFSESDLHVALRRAGVGGYADVAAAVLERSGTISVIRRNPGSTEALGGLRGQG